MLAYAKANQIIACTLGALGSCHFYFKFNERKRNKIMSTLVMDT